MRNALIIGASGMLSGLVPKLMAQEYQVFAIGRSRERLAALEEACAPWGPRLTVMALDYRDTDRLARWVAHIQLLHGPLDAVVAWIHGNPTAVLSAVGQAVEGYRQFPWDLYHVVGLRASLSPPQPPAGLSHCRYHRIVLGFLEEGERTRWLSHEEIVQGVYAAFQDQQDREVGQVRPYANRPQ
jgi:hypothetical protein